ncbi:cysteine hydrolase [Acinetobacter baumannii]|uniref:cysteine hydrolase family protein n=1 Tax=Acinetobacter baumannii TaxID=470 RepID=UPI002297059C|nr:cysteine hydrolase family protein [Acinetobacter baumannii]MDC4639851.1 cysteine hydrolase [Acinetobacter baumannii]MDC4985384.1 cysteine hydrolase [Acinetobacter baumannii]MDC5275008.1 cysteine hydrolase [Acinetobacter baumannii]MDP7916860.1 cysteine hydrolase family protein [Acinetobacter baumannii]HCA5185508.1 cysteine hydrolase [Acinetobacter baumannii]
MKQALLVIDVQNDYFKNGKMELVGPDQALDKIKQLEQYFNEKDLPIIYVQHINPPQASFFQENTEGVLLHPELSAGSDSLIVTKHYPNSFLETNLKELLKAHQIEQLVITGMMTHICIDSGTRAAKELGYQPILIGDATATHDLSHNGKTVKAEDVQTAFLAALGMFASVQNTADFLAKS